MKLLRLLVLSLACVLAALPLCGQAQDRPADPWRPIQRLLGDWVGTTEGQAGTASVSRRYAQVLRGRFVHETNMSTYPPQERNKAGEVHEHTGMFSHDKARKVLVLRHFHIEGFVNTYRQVSEPGAALLVFESEVFENFNNAWKARETYEFTGDDEFVETFELAPPGKPFQVYSRTQLKRMRPAQ
ncbi:hypothetical protein HLB44_32005 [Aquincola sp. S2]|uniref:DUF1579 domain-containing protein n=1 Tax=Pseudaquabacterium terrae TaxID=2732868 RepID=A0ABX2ESL0_9BURK|nr:hypothetical protein [Aquabacterium terrae]NRF71622.1 hypothetical protein [Aquabacterium terrae]